MLKLLAAIPVFATLASAIYVGEESVYVGVDKMKFPPVVVLNPKMPYLEFNSPAMRGVISFTNLMAHGTDTLDLNTKFDPVNQVLYMDVNQVNFDVTANYTGRLHFRRNNTVLEGAGVFRLSATRYHISDVEFAVNYRPYAGKFQVEYPTRFEPKAVENLNVEMTGLKCAATGEPASGIDLYRLTEGYEKPGFMSFWPALVNFNMQSGYAKNIGNGLVHAFFDSI